VKNLNFTTTELQLEKLFKEAKIGSVKSVKIVRRSDTQQSRGYGFVEVDSQESAEKAVKKLQNVLLDDHALKLSLSTKAITQAEEEQKKEKVLKKRKAEEPTETQMIESDAVSNKLLVKNLAFEATSAEIKELFSPYGHIRKVRLPLKANSTNHRGFGFVEFVTIEEAKNAFKHLQNSHLYSRKLVIEYA
jgi:multiple RNA-binding domain-containing protein 1